MSISPLSRAPKRIDLSMSEPEEGTNDWAGREQIASLGVKLSGLFDTHAQSHAAIEAGIAVLTGKVETVQDIANSIDDRVARQGDRVRDLEASRSGMSEKVSGLAINVKATEKRVDGIPARVRSWALVAVSVLSLGWLVFQYTVDLVSDVKAGQAPPASATAPQIPPEQ